MRACAAALALAPLARFPEPNQSSPPSSMEIKGEVLLVVIDLGREMPVPIVNSIP